MPAALTATSTSPSAGNRTRHVPHLEHVDVAISVELHCSTHKGYDHEVAVAIPPSDRPQRIAGLERRSRAGGHVLLSAMWGIGLLAEAAVRLVVSLAGVRRRRERCDVADLPGDDRPARMVATFVVAGRAPRDGGNKADSPKVERIRFNFGGLMTEPIAVPVLFVSEPIVLPGMVVPIELDEAARIAVDAAQASDERQAADRPAARRPLPHLRRDRLDRAGRSRSRRRCRRRRPR